jgi:cold shock CspA family protein
MTQDTCEVRRSGLADNLQSWRAGAPGEKPLSPPSGESSLFERNWRAAESDGRIKPTGKYAGSALFGKAPAPSTLPIPKVAQVSTESETAGTIVSVNDQRGFGFVRIADGRAVFFHRASTQRPTICLSQQFAAAQAVDFCLRSDPRKPGSLEATRIRPAGEAWAPAADRSRCVNVMQSCLCGPMWATMLPARPLSNVTYSTRSNAPAPAGRPRVRRWSRRPRRRRRRARSLA